MKEWISECGRVRLINDDCRNVAGLSVDHVITDIPYSETTHKGARSTVYRGARDGGVCAIDFASADSSLARSLLSAFIPQRWCLSFIDWRHALPLELDPPQGLEFIRLGVWSKLNPMPQLTGDRPSTGWESIAIFHPKGAKRWNGGSGPALWMHGTSRYGYFGESNHPTEKPLGLVIKLVEQFTDQGELIADPCMGSGTTGIACIRTGRRFVGVELDAGYFDIAVNRIKRELAQPFMPGMEPQKHEQKELI